VFWISRYEIYGRNALVIAIYSATRNTGNSRNRVETARVGLGSHAEQTWNSGNKPSSAPRLYPRDAVWTRGAEFDLWFCLPRFIRRCVAPSPHLLLMGTGAFESCILQLPLRNCCADFQNGARVSTIVWITTFLRRLQPQRTVIGPVASPALPSVTALLRPLAAPGVCGASALLSHHAGRFRRSASFCHRFWISSLQCRRHPTFRPLLFK